MKQKKHIQHLGHMQNGSEEIHQVLSAKCKRGLKLQAEKYFHVSQGKKKDITSVSKI